VRVDRGIIIPDFREMPAFVRKVLRLEKTRRGRRERRSKAVLAALKDVS
jgi:hypothetical protein